MATGACMLAWVGLARADSYLAQRLARAAMASVPLAAAPVHSAAEPPGTAATPGRPAMLPRGAPVGELSIPRVGLSAVVLHGSDTRTLRRGPGHLEQTVLPGQSGNIVVAGHRDSFFRPVRNVQLGDDVFIDTPRGRFEYRVSSLYVVEPTDLSVLDATDTPTLTLITCYPFWLAGPAPDRYIVRAVEVARPAGAAEQFATATPALFSGSTTLEGGVAPRPRTLPSDPAETHTGARRLDDDTLVRQAVERFRATYNARLARRARPGDAGESPVSFRGCDVAVHAGEATAACADMLDEPGTGRLWIFTLRAEPGGWRMVSVEPR